MQQRPVNMTISDLIRYLLFLTTDLILAYILSKKKSYPQINLPSEVANLSEFQFEQTLQKIADLRQKSRNHSGLTIRLNTTEINSLFYGGYRKFLGYSNDIRSDICITTYSLKNGKLIEKTVAASKILLLQNKVRFVCQKEIEHRFYVENDQIYDKKRYRVVRGMKSNFKTYKSIENIQNSQSLLGKILLNTERNRVNVRRKFDINLPPLEDRDIGDILIEDQELKVTLKYQVLSQKMIE